ncbi:MAG: hypothetical protein WCI47_00370 [bacterium]
MAVKKAIHPSLTVALQQGWKATSHYLGFYITLVLLIVLFNLVPSVIDSIFTNTTWFSPVLRGSFIIIIALITLGMVRTTLQSVDSKEPSIVDLFKTHLFFRYLLTSVLYLGMFVGGLVLFIAPGIYWGLKYQFATYLVAEDRYTISEAFEESARMVEGHEWDLFAYWLVMMMLNTLGLLFFGIGIVITLPVTLVGYSYIYKQLRVGRTHPKKK